jgi:hypothetical protein
MFLDKKLLYSSQKYYVMISFTQRRKILKEIIDNLQTISWLFPIFSGFIVISCVVYCLIWWQPHPMTIFDVDCSFVCWNFCRTMSKLWAAIAIIVASLSVFSGILFKLRNKYAIVTAAFSGVLTLPVGVLPLLTIWLNRKQLTTENKEYH